MTEHATASAAVLTELRRAIATGELSPGEQLRQEALAERFGVSRVPLREALHVLEGEGQVTHHAHRGYFVAELSLADLLEVYRLRALLEGEAARVSVATMSDEEIDRLGELLAIVETASVTGDVAGMVDANRAFHFALVEGAQMPRLSRLVRALWDATDVYRAVYYGSDTNRDAVNREHARILAAIKARDAELVVHELDEHRAGAVRELTSLVTEPRSPERR